MTTSLGAPSNPPTSCHPCAGRDPTLHTHQPISSIPHCRARPGNPAAPRRRSERTLLTRPQPPIPRPHPHPGFAHLLPSREKARLQYWRGGILPPWSADEGVRPRREVPEGRMRGTAHRPKKIHPPTLRPIIVCSYRFDARCRRGIAERVGGQVQAVASGVTAVPASLRGAVRHKSLRNGRGDSPTDYFGR